VGIGFSKKTYRQCNQVSRPTRPAQIHVRASTEDGKVTCCVEDNGKGIVAEYLDKVFNLFARLDPEAAERKGIGLPHQNRRFNRWWRRHLLCKIIDLWPKGFGIG
jgi:type II restriction/modification system DNA methylase subunit YeeA